MDDLDAFLSITDLFLNRREKITTETSVEIGIVFKTWKTCQKPKIATKGSAIVGEQIPPLPPFLGGEPTAFDNAVKKMREKIEKKQ